MTQTRVPRGVHTAGQYAASAKAEAGLALVGERQASEEEALRLSQDSEISRCAACAGSGSNANGDAGCSLCEGTGQMTRAEHEAYAEVTAPDEFHTIVDCAMCNGTGLREFDDFPCGLCDGSGTATRAQYDEHVAYLADLAQYTDDYYTDPEPDVEAIAERRAESAYERRGAAIEWGGMDV